MTGKMLRNLCLLMAVPFIGMTALLCWSLFCLGEHVGLNYFNLFIYGTWMTFFLCIAIHSHCVLMKKGLWQYRFDNNLCVHCGYDRRGGGPEDLCPECGTMKRGTRSVRLDELERA